MDIVTLFYIKEKQLRGIELCRGSGGKPKTTKISKSEQKNLEDSV